MSLSIMFFAILWGLLTGYVAAHFSRNPMIWGICGGLCFIVTMPILLICGHNCKCPYCCGSISPSATVCRHCRKDVA